MSTLEAQGASVERGGRTILDSAEIRISSGELKAVVGPNGGGKSTLLRALAGIWGTSNGAVVLDGKNLSSLSRNYIARRIAFVPQEQRTEFAFTAAEVVEMGRHPHRGRFALRNTHDREAVELAMERCDIAYLRNRRVNTLSGGEYQRVLIARSLAVEPDIILLDEPTASLDVEHALEVMELCRSLASGGKAVVLATHDLNAAARFATSIVLVDQGRVLDCDDQDQVLSTEHLQKTFGVRAELLSTSDGQPVYVFHSLSKKPDKENSRPMTGS